MPSLYRVFKTGEFDRDFEALEKAEKRRIEKFLAQLAEKGGAAGKPLSAPFFREKKFNGKMLYFLVYENVLVVLAVAISNKKAQQATINAILAKLAQYQEPKMNPRHSWRGFARVHQHFAKMKYCRILPIWQSVVPFTGVL